MSAAPRIVTSELERYIGELCRARPYACSPGLVGRRSETAFRVVFGAAIYAASAVSRAPATGRRFGPWIAGVRGAGGALAGGRVCAGPCAFVDPWSVRQEVDHAKHHGTMHRRHVRGGGDRGGRGQR